MNLRKSLLVSMVSLFAVLNGIAGYIPLTPILGFGGKSFKLEWITGSLSGVILGVPYGVISPVLGEIMQGGNGTFGFLSYLTVAIPAFQIGLLRRKKWKIPLFVLAALTVTWTYMTGLCVAMVPHIIGIFLIPTLTLLRRVNDNDFLSILISSYCGNITRHASGCILLSLMYGFTPTTFITALPLTIAEQTFFCLGTAVIGTPMLSKLNEFGLPQ